MPTPSVKSILLGICTNCFIFRHVSAEPKHPSSKGHAEAQTFPQLHFDCVALPPIFNFSSSLNHVEKMSSLQFIFPNLLSKL